MVWRLVLSACCYVTSVASSVVMVVVHMFGTILNNVCKGLCVGSEIHDFKLYEINLETKRPNY